MEWPSLVADLGCVPRGDALPGRRQTRRSDDRQLRGDLKVVFAVDSSARRRPDRQRCPKSGHAWRSGERRCRTILGLLLSWSPHRAVVPI